MPTDFKFLDMTCFIVGNLNKAVKGVEESE